jgi:hypothetical protein
MTALRKHPIAIQIERLERRQIAQMNQRKHRAESKMQRRLRAATNRVRSIR